LAGAFLFGLLGIVFTIMPNPAAAADRPLGLITVDPGHFHAALFQREMLPGISETVHVYAPLSPDLAAHLNRVAQFNNRPENPTHWKLEVHAGADFWRRMLAEPLGNIVVLSGNNRGKIDRIAAIVQRGLHVLADKPWIIEPEEFPKLQAALEGAKQQGVTAYDAMTQRFEITCRLQRELVNDREVFGPQTTGSPAVPAVHLESLHYLLKEVAGMPLLRPPWFFDVRQQGEGLADVGTHLVDLVQWTLFPEQAIDWRQDLQVLNGSRWPVVLSRAQFQRVTGERNFPEFLRSAIKDDRLEYFANTTVRYLIRGVHVQLDVKWEVEPAAGAKDTELAIFCGTKSKIELRQGEAERFQPEIYVVPLRPELKADVRQTLTRKIAALQGLCPGLTMTEQTGQFRLVIPPASRIGHEAHFGLLTSRFLEYARNPKTVPTWEKANMLAKYYVTTKGIALARATSKPTSTQKTP
jgi:predicted dehydrogenase